MDELEIKIVLDFKVPENGLTLNGIFYGLDKDNPSLMNYLIKAILEAFEEKAIAELKSSHPGRYARNGRQCRGRKFITSSFIGDSFFCLRQIPLNFPQFPPVSMLN